MRMAMTTVLARWMQQSSKHSNSSDQKTATPTPKIVTTKETLHMTEPSEKRGSVTLYPRMETVRQMIQQYEENHPMQKVTQTPQQEAAKKILERTNPGPVPGPASTDNSESTNKK